MMDKIMHELFVFKYLFFNYKVKKKKQATANERHLLYNSGVAPSPVNSLKISGSSNSLNSVLKATTPYSVFSGNEEQLVTILGDNNFHIVETRMILDMVLTKTSPSNDVAYLVFPPVNS